MNEFKDSLAKIVAADPFLAKADALLAKIAGALDPKAEPLAKAVPQSPLEKATAAVEALAKAVAAADFADLEERLAKAEAS
jgi:hypothetical protein